MPPTTAVPRLLTWLVLRFTPTQRVVLAVSSLMLAVGLTGIGVYATFTTTGCSLIRAV